MWKQSLTHGPEETPRWIRYSYDGANRLRTITSPDGSFSETIYENDVDHFSYEARFDALGNETVVWKDAYGNLVEVQEQIGNEFAHTKYEYDLLGNLTRVIDAHTNQTLITWDSLGRKLSSSDPDLGTWTYTYDDGGLLLTQTDAKAQTIYFAYDALGRMLQKILPNAETTTWFYDEPGYGASIGRLTRVLTPAGSETHTWDIRGLEVETTRCVGNVCETIGQTYDALGRVAAVTYPDGEVVDYTYNEQGRLASVGGYVQQMSWSASGQLNTLTYANGTVSSFTYNPDRAWLEQAHVQGPTGQLYQASYAYDAAANITAIASESIVGLPDRLADIAETTTWFYDEPGYGASIGRLTRVLTPAGSETHTWDIRGLEVETTRCVGNVCETIGLRDQQARIYLLQGQSGQSF